MIVVYGCCAEWANAEGKGSENTAAARAEALPRHGFTIKHIAVSGWPWDTTVVIEWHDKATLATGAPYDNDGVHVQDRESAQALLRALGAASFPETDLDILEPETVVAAADKLRQSRTLLGRIGSVLGDEGSLADRSLELARAGHPIVLVHAPSKQEVDRARPVLASQRVLLATHYGALLITDL